MKDTVTAAELSVKSLQLSTRHVLVISERNRSVGKNTEFGFVISQTEDCVMLGLIPCSAAQQSQAAKV